MFSSETTFESLVEEFGINNVVSAAIHDDEASYELGVLIFPGTEDEVEVFWHDPLSRKVVRKVRIHGDRSSWRMSSGLELGMDLHSIEAHNRKPFRIVGFGWDYGGTIVSWEDGYLESEPSDSCRAIVRLGYDSSKYTWDLMSKHGSVDGMDRFSSGHPTIQQMNPYIREISLFFKLNEWW